MTQEQKDLLLKDICARLPYDVMVDYESRIYILNEIDPACKDIDYITVRIQDVERLMCAKNVMIENIKPYLFPLSSMTEEQKNRLKEIWSADMDKAIDYSISGEERLSGLCELSAAREVIDWLNANHFDYRGLIEKKLAIDSTNLNVY